MKMKAASMPSLPAIIGWGSGGHAKSVIDAVESLGFWRIVGLVDPDATRWGAASAGKRVLGGEDQLGSLLADGVHNAFFGVGGVGNNAPRIQVFQRLLDHGYLLPPICHRTAIVSPSARIGTD